MIQNLIDTSDTKKLKIDLVSYTNCKNDSKLVQRSKNTNNFLIS